MPTNQQLKQKHLRSVASLSLVRRRPSIPCPSPGLLQRQCVMVMPQAGRRDKDDDRTVASYVPRSGRRLAGASDLRCVDSAAADWGPSILLLAGGGPAAGAWDGRAAPGRDRGRDGMGRRRGSRSVGAPAGRRSGRAEPERDSVWASLARPSGVAAERESPRRVGVSGAGVAWRWRPSRGGGLGSPSE